MRKAQASCGRPYTPAFIGLRPRAHTGAQAPSRPWALHVTRAVALPRRLAVSGAEPRFASLWRRCGRRRRRHRLRFKPGSWRGSWRSVRFCGCVFHRNRNVCERIARLAHSCFRGVPCHDVDHCNAEEEHENDARSCPINAAPLADDDGQLQSLFIDVVVDRLQHARLLGGTNALNLLRAWHLVVHWASRLTLLSLLELEPPIVADRLPGA
mmetsp:Transcript_78821/g.219103  ORF Transcript_78821/g.219103 Transcript_78821/m.219103 type:complete len:211 (+) Transcript_78821:161-793(+)